MVVIGMTGPIGHGKSTFAKAICTLEPQSKRLESSLIIAEVANALHATTVKIPDRDDIDGINNWLKPLPAILLEKLHTKCSFEQIKLELSDISQHPVEYEKLFLHIENLNRDPKMLGQDIDKDNKESYRPILQWLGGYLVKKVDPGIWYKEIVRRVYNLENEGYKLCIIGGLRFPLDADYVHKVGGIVIKVYRPDHLQFDSLDPTERERDDIKPDSTLISNGTIEDVKNSARTVLSDLYAGNLQKTYYSKS